MPPLKIVQSGHPVLRRRARELAVKEIRSRAIQDLIEHMRETMREAPGVGLAAPQIGEPLQLAVIEDREEYQRNVAASRLELLERRPVPFHVIVNPRLTLRASSGPVRFFEGCLSVTGVVGLVPRALDVRVEALDENGDPVTIDAHGWHARILQHEIDHLAGTLCIDRMYSRSLMTQENYSQYWGNKSVDEVWRELELDRPPE
jgi:peptide deformylase